MTSKINMTRARILTTFIALTTGHHATALAAIATGITGAVVSTGMTNIVASRFDDPYVWGAAALGIAAAHWRIPTVSRGLAISNGCIGVGLSAIGGPWFTSLAAMSMPSNPPPVALVAFLVAVGWGYVFKKLAPIVPRLLRTIVLSWFNIKDSKGDK